jgi:regulator of protease activity HflC (stomatin/prohibitin superfamily)
MKNILLIACSALALTGCHYASVDPGEQGVAVEHPWFFGNGGVSDEVINPGTKVIAISTSVEKVPTTPIAFTVEFTHMPSDGIPLNFHTTVRVQVTDPVELVKHWNGAAKDEKGNSADVWFWGTINPIYTNLVRQDVKRFTMQDMAFGQTAVDQIEQHVSDQLSAFIARNHMPVRLLSVTIGRASPPQEILDQRTATAEQQQREKTMEAQQKAEEARKGAEMARAAADNSYRSEMQLSPEQYVELQRIKMQGETCGKEGNCTFIFGNATPLINSK